MRLILYSKDSVTLVFPSGKTYYIWANEQAKPGGVIANGKRILWGQLPAKDINSDCPVIRLSNKTFSFAFSANECKMYGHTLDESLWLSVLDEKDRGHDLER